MNKLQTVGFDISLIHKSKTIEEALDVIKKVDALKTALEAVDEFHNKSVMYAQLEIEALLKVVELGGINKLHGNKKNVAEWFIKLSPEERNEIIEECTDGITLGYLYKIKIKEPEREADAIRYYSRVGDSIVENFQNGGVADMNEFRGSYRGYTTEDQIIADIKDGVRGRLRKAGAVGIGDGIYIRPKCGRPDEVKKAIAIRLDSVLSDIANIKKICVASRIRIKREDYFDLLEEKWDESEVFEELLDSIENLVNDK